MNSHTAITPPRPARQTTYEVIRELEQRARAINGGKQLPRPWSQANGGPY